MTGDRDPQRVGELLGRVGRSLGVDDAVALGKLSSSWQQMVGEQVAAHARPTSLKQGVLRLRVSSPIWATEIGYLVPRIRSQVNAVLGPNAVKEIRIYNAPERDGDGDRLHERSLGRPPIAAKKGDGSSDPQEALERARNAWQKGGSQRRDGGHSAGESTC